INASCCAKRAEVGSFEKASHAKQERLAPLPFFSKKCERQALSEHGKRKLVLFVTECTRNFLKEGCVATVRFDQSTKARRFTLKTKLCGSVQHTVDLSFGQFFERTMASTWTGQRNIGGKCLR